MKQHPLSDSLRDSFEAAQSKTAAVEGTPIAWDRPRRARRRVAEWTLAGLVVCAVGAFLFWHYATTDELVSTASGQLAGATGQSNTARIAGDPAWQRPSSPASSASVSVNGAVIDMSFSNTPLVDAVRLLASKTDTRVHGVEQLAGLGAKRDFHWQGAGLADAWVALLTHLPNKTISCSGAACEVWITSVLVSGSSPAFGVDRSPAPRTPPEWAAWWATQAAPSSQQQPSGASATQISQPPASSEKTTDDGISN